MTPAEVPPAEAALDPLLAPLASLPGVGPQIARRLAEAVGGDRVLDLLFHLPERYASRIRVDSPEEAPPEAEVILPALVGGMRAARARTGRSFVELRAECGRPAAGGALHQRPAGLAAAGCCRKAASGCSPAS